MPPLKKFKKEILSGLCWDELKKLPTKAEVKKICEWEGWHWILRGQLECFFGFEDKFEPPKKNI